jgi:hypothetical protein
MEHKSKMIPPLTLLALSMMLHASGCVNQLPAAGSNPPVTIMPEPELRAIVFKAGRPTVSEQLEDSVVSWKVSQQSLVQNAETIANTPYGLKFRVIGSTDGYECQGDDCASLALRRARLVADWLSLHGVESERVSWGAGPADTPSHALDESGSEGLRRVTIEPSLVVPPEAE